MFYSEDNLKIIIVLRIRANSPLKAAAVRKEIFLLKPCSITGGEAVDVSADTSAVIFCWVYCGSDGEYFP